MKYVYIIWGKIDDHHFIVKVCATEQFALTIQQTMTRRAAKQKLSPIKPTYFIEERVVEKEEV